MRALGPSLRDYLGHLRNSRTEVAIFIAGVLLVLSLAEPLLMRAAEALAPAWHAEALLIDPQLRRWMAGLPLAFALTAVVVWRDWRRLMSAPRQARRP